MSQVSITTPHAHLKPSTDSRKTEFCDTFLLTQEVNGMSFAELNQLINQRKARSLNR